jgi:hypothetical protein
MSRHFHIYSIVTTPGISLFRYQDAGITIDIAMGNPASFVFPDLCTFIPEIWFQVN